MSVAQRIAEKRLKQLTNKFAKWASFSSPFSGFGLQRTLPSVCWYMNGARLCKTVSWSFCFTFNHKMQLMHRFVCFLIILVAIRAALTCSRSNGSGGFDCAWCVNKPESRIKRENVVIMEQSNRFDVSWIFWLMSAACWPPKKVFLFFYVKRVKHFRCNRDLRA